MFIHSGFCSWGVSGEYCPDYPWTAECMGPNTDWSSWTIINNKLYLFFEDAAKKLFLEDPDYYIGIGNKRWDGWYGSRTGN
jgi:hypothetical protein